MISKEKAKKFIESKKTSPITENDLKKLSKPYQFLGSLIANFKNTPRYFDPNNIDGIDIYLTHFGSDYSYNPWETKEGMQLAEILFGAYQSPYVSGMWQLMNELPYQSGWERRSFRGVPSRSHLLNKIRMLFGLYLGNVQGFKSMSLIELARYNVYGSGYTSSYRYLFAAALNNKDNEDFRTVIEEILLGEDEIGGVTRSLIGSLLITNDPYNWKIVEKLLLAAQREEGLRQTILESLDETSLGAIRHMIQVMLDENLMRFSSVVRAVDTWFGFEWKAPKLNTIKRILELVISCFDEPSNVKMALQSKDNLEVYVALWFLGLHDVDHANSKAIDLIESGDKEKIILACMFMKQTQRTRSRINKWIEENVGQDPEIDFWVMNSRPKSLEIDEKLYNRLLTMAQQIPKDGIKCEGRVFSWTKYTITSNYFFGILIEHANESQFELLSKDLASIPSHLRYHLILKIYPGYNIWGGTSNEKKTNFESIAWKRELVFGLLKGRNNDLKLMSVLLLEDMDLQKDDLSIIESLLAGKGKSFREKLIKLLISQSEENVKEVSVNLLASNKIDQRLAGLEILSVLYDKNKLPHFVNTQILSYKDRSKLSKNETVFLDKFSVSEEKLSIDNGFGVINYMNLRPLYQCKEMIAKPLIQKSSLTSKFIRVLKGIKKEKVSINANLINPELYDIPRTVAAVNDLMDLFVANKDYEYKQKKDDGSYRTILLSNEVSYLDVSQFKAPKKDRLEALPLYDLWKEWYSSANLNDFEMLAAHHYCNSINSYINLNDQLTKFRMRYIPNLEGVNVGKDNGRNSRSRSVGFILGHLISVYCDQKMITNFQLSQMEDVICTIPKKAIANEGSNNAYNYRNRWTDCIDQLILGRINLDQFKDDRDGLELIARYWDLQIVLLYARKYGFEIAPSEKQLNIAKLLLKDNGRYSMNSWMTLLLYDNAYISDDDLKYHYLLSDSLMEVVDGKKNRYTSDLVISDQVSQITAPLKANLLSVELDRGDIVTEATKFMNNINSIKGISYLIDLLERLGKADLLRGYYWSRDSNKKESFSCLIRKCVPADGETLDDFINLAKNVSIPKKRWVEVAMYAPQWSEWIGVLIKLTQLKSGVWWFHAHGSELMDAEKETILSQYSAIEKEDFKLGAVDIDWFHSFYDYFGKSNWKLVHDAAKYVSFGNGHRQIKLYSSIMLGETKIRETLVKIKDKRDKDYVRALGLVPLSKANREKDLLNRYDLLQSFLKESRQFGSQRQQSEKIAVNVGMENLARNAGYDGSIRFAWAMEGKATQLIMSKSKKEFDNVTVELKVDDQGKANIEVIKAGKFQKTIPAKLKKDKAIVELLASRNYLRTQYSRTRKSLESAMVTEEIFSGGEIVKIMEHPVVFAMLSKLVLVNREKSISGIWKDGYLIKHDGSSTKIVAKDFYVIAHPSHLFQLVEWDLYQKYAFEQKIIQPFKQIFRELYVVTDNERELGINSNRYQGHQIQPMKAAALLKGRGWTVNHYEGLQKVYHKKKVIANLYAMADWFSPADIEAPALEHVSFYNRKDRKAIAMGAIDPIVFSEVMRDVDLVVSVAHVGGVDPEASHSTMEMRAVLASESVRLFKFDNVEILERYIKISGKLGEYSIHLGSGQVSKSGLSLSIIPVHSQHRGRVFLPFIDDDPKSAEIISKMKLLAEDYKIKDPTILAQINK